MAGLLVRYRIAVIILFYFFQFVWFQTRSSLLAVESIQITAWLSLLFLLVFWLTVLFDMMKTEIYHKAFWMLSMLVLPWLTPAVYLFQRNKLGRIQTSVFNRKGQKG